MSDISKEELLEAFINFFNCYEKCDSFINIFLKEYENRQANKDNVEQNDLAVNKTEPIIEPKQDANDASQPVMVRDSEWKPFDPPPFYIESEIYTPELNKNLTQSDIDRMVDERFASKEDYDSFLILDHRGTSTVIGCRDGLLLRVIGRGIKSLFILSALEGEDEDTCIVGVLQTRLYMKNLGDAMLYEPEKSDYFMQYTVDKFDRLLQIMPRQK